MPIIRGNNGPKIDWVALIVSLVIGLPALLWFVRNIDELWMRLVIVACGVAVFCALVQVVRNSLGSRLRSRSSGRNDPKQPGR